MKDPLAPRHSMKDPVLPTPRRLGAGPGTGPAGPCKGAAGDGHREVAVVGGGVVGLTCALELARAGHRVRVHTADPPEATTSAVALRPGTVVHRTPEPDLW